MLERVLIVSSLAFSALPAFGASSLAPIIVRSSTNATDRYTATAPGGPAQYASWTQAAGSPFSSVTIKLALCSTDGSPASGTVYLTNQVGAGTTTSNQVATVSVSTSAFCNDATASSPLTLFTGLTLPAVSATTYYLVVAESSINLGVQWKDFPTETAATGVTSNPDGYVPGATASYPPATAFNAIGSPARGILFSVTGLAGLPPAPTGVPALGTFALMGAFMLLAFSGLLFLKRESVNPIR